MVLKENWKSTIYSFKNIYKLPSIINSSHVINLKFPSSLTQAFSPIKRIGSSSDVFLSFDWFIKSSKIVAFTPSTAIFKIFLTGLLPIGLILITFVIWGLLYLTRLKWFKDFKRNFIISVIVILFILHPVLWRVAFEMFEWVKVDTNLYKVKLDLDIVCFSLEHMAWWAMIALPILIIWAAGCPILVFIILFKNRKSLQEKYMQNYFLMLYQGLKDNVFYWELVNTLRKVILVSINVLCQQYLLSIQQYLQ